MGVVQLEHQCFGKFDGILGLACGTILVNGIVPPLYNTIDQGLLHEPLFSFRVGLSEDGGGEAIFGESGHPAYASKINCAPIRRKGYWGNELEKVSLGDNALELENTGAAIDTVAPSVLSLMSFFGATPRCWTWGLQAPSD
ncbi:acid protease [Paxillus ammoniavirescens]|nr:acid protease [Paxillus ammoniavirescens]